MSLKLGLFAGLLASYVGISSLDAQVSVKEGSGTTYIMPISGVECSLDSLCRDPGTFYEDLWLFHKGKLVDVGVDEHKFHVMPCDIRIACLISECDFGDTVIAYHIHPDSYKNSRFSPPSSFDLMNHAELKRYLSKKNIVLISKVFDGRGRWEYDSSDALTYLITSDEKMKERLNEDFYYTIKYKCDEGILSNSFVLSKKDFYNDPYALQDYIDSMSELGMNLKFITKENIEYYPGRPKGVLNNN